MSLEKPIYKLVVAFDLHDENGKSILLEDVHNTSEYKMTLPEAKNINIRKVIERAEVFLADCLATGFVEEHPRPIDRGAFREVWMYNDPRSLPLGASLPHGYHSNIKSQGSIPYGKMLKHEYRQFVKIGNEDYQYNDGSQNSQDKS